MVVSTVTDDIRMLEIPKLTVCALKFTEGARAKIVKAGGECITFDELALRAPKGQNTVILRARKGENIPLETLLALAQIVLIESRVAVGEAIDVQYTRVANLRPISPANPGRTAVTSERVLHVRRDDGALVGWSRVS